MAGISTSSYRSTGTDAELHKLANSKTLKDEVARSLRGKTATLVVVGPAGAGKSSLVNTLVLKELCKTEPGAKPVTEKLKQSRLSVPLSEKPGDVCWIDVIDSPGRTGRLKHDQETARQLRTVQPNSFHLLICCFDLTAHSGRFLPLEHFTTLQWLAKIFGEECMRTKCIIVLTKANTLIDEPSDLTYGGKASHALDTRPQSAKNLFEEWNDEYKEHITEEGPSYLLVPTFMAGRVKFGRDKNPTSRSKIDGSYQWLDTLWLGIAHHVGQELTTLLTFINDEAQKATPWHLPEPTIVILEKVAVYVLATLVVEHEKRPGLVVAYTVVGGAVALPVLATIGTLAMAGGTVVAAGMGAWKLYKYIRSKVESE